MSKKAKRVKTPTPVSSGVVDAMEARLADAPSSEAVTPTPIHAHASAHDGSPSHDNASNASPAAEPGSGSS